jgi:hypothetical protein
MAQKTPEERFLMGCSMYDTAKQIVIASIQEMNPNISPLDLRKEVFLRFYKTDFTPAAREKILSWFSSNAESNS